MTGYGEALKDILHMRNISKPQLAEAIGLSKGQIYAIMNNESFSTTEKLKQLSQMLDVPSDYLLKDFHKFFLVAAIDDYYSKLLPEQISQVQGHLSLFLEENGHG